MFFLPRVIFTLLSFGLAVPLAPCFTNPTEFFYDDADSSMMASMLDIT